MKKTLLIFTMLLLVISCSTDMFINEDNPQNVELERKNNNKGKKKAIVLAPSFDVMNREAGNMNLTAPVDYPDGVNFDFDTRVAELNGVTYSIEYEVWNNIVTTNTFIVASDGSLNLDVDAEFIKTVNMNGSDVVLFADNQGVKDLNGNLLYSSDNFDGIGVYHALVSFDVTDMDDDGTDDLLVCYSSADAHKVEIVHDFLGSAVVTPVLFEMAESTKLLGVMEEAGEKYVVFWGGARECLADGSSVMPFFSRSQVLTEAPPVSYAELLESMVVISAPNNANTATVLEFTQLPSCERFYVTVTGLNGEYVGYGTGSVKNVDVNGEGYFSLIRYEPDGDAPASYDIASGNYLIVFPAVPSSDPNDDPNEPVKIPLLIP